MKEFLGTLAGVIIIAGLIFMFWTGEGDTMKSETESVGNGMITEMKTIDRNITTP